MKKRTELRIWYKAKINSLVGGKWLKIQKKQEVMPVKDGFLFEWLVPLPTLFILTNYSFFKSLTQKQ